MKKVTLKTTLFCLVAIILTQTLCSFSLEELQDLEAYSLKINNKTVQEQYNIYKSPHVAPNSFVEFKDLIKEKDTRVFYFRMKTVNGKKDLFFLYILETVEEKNVLQTVVVLAPVGVYQNRHGKHDIVVSNMTIMIDGKSTKIIK